MIQNAKEKYGVYFVAELGQNHQGVLDVAKKMIDSLVGAGVSAIKTAKRDIDTCLTEEQKKQPYINSNSFGETYYEHRKALELSKDDFRKMKGYAESKGFDFFSSFTDSNSLDFLNEIGVKILKIASSRITDIGLLEKVADTKKTVIISTGMSDLSDVERAVDIFTGNEKYLLQCTSCYPCAEKDINLNVLRFYQKNFDCDGYGFSGHHTGIAPDLAAYMMGADIIERHYTLRRDMKGTDHAASLEKSGVNYIMKYINEIRLSMGDFKKRVLGCEQPAIKKLR